MIISRIWDFDDLGGGFSRLRVIFDRGIFSRLKLIVLKKIMVNFYDREQLLKVEGLYYHGVLSRSRF